MISLPRRRFLQASATAMAATAATPLWATGSVRPWLTVAERRAIGLPEDLAGLVDPARLKQLALRAVDAAKAAGASYADVRLTRTVEQEVGRASRMSIQAVMRDSETLFVGVRCLVGGVWGFASSPFWELEEMSVLAERAVLLAKANAANAGMPVELAPAPVASGTWTTPIEIDPFTVSFEEKWDTIRAIQEIAETYSASRTGTVQPAKAMHFDRQERALATTEGTFIVQTLYTTRIESGEAARYPYNEGVAHAFSTGMAFNHLGMVGGGYEVLRNSRWIEQTPGLLAQYDELYGIPEKPLDIGRYDVVCTPAVMARLLGATLGAATEVDRIMGYEANATGTSYLGNNPLELLGTQIVSPLITVTANRSAPRALGTVKWDDEGVEPDNTTLIQDGVLVDLQTTREHASWLAPYYQRVGKPVRSHGHAGAASAQFPTVQMRPNLVLEPGPSNASLGDLVREVKHGVLLQSGSIRELDHQSKNGIFVGVVREINNGKLGAFTNDVYLWFNSADLWKNLLAVGGRQTSAFPGYVPLESDDQPVGLTASKGQPSHSAAYSVNAVPAVLKGMAVIDPFRR